MYKMLRIFIVTFVLLCDIRVIISKPLSEEQQELNVESLNHNHQGIINDNNNNNNNGLIKSVVIHRDPAEFLQVFHEDNSDTKKQYYLIKINEYYDFLPLHRNEDNHQLRLEIVDKGDMNHQVIKDDDDSRELVKREISDNTLRDSVNLLQTNFMGKRSVSNTNFKSKFTQSDLGNFYGDPGQITGIDLADSEDESKMNFKYFAYVPFFRVRKYYLQQNLLD